MRAVQYSFDEAVASLWRGRTSGVLSTATIAVALFVLGAFLVLTSNLERLGLEWSRAAEMSVYLDRRRDARGRSGPWKRLLAPGSVVDRLSVHLEDRSASAVQADVRRSGGCG